MLAIVGHTSSLCVRIRQLDPVFRWTLANSISPLSIAVNRQPETVNNSLWASGNIGSDSWASVDWQLEGVAGATCSLRHVIKSLKSTCKASMMYCSVVKSEARATFSDCNRQLLSLQSKRWLLNRACYRHSLLISTCNRQLLNLQSKHCYPWLTYRACYQNSLLIYSGYRHL